MDRLPPTKLTCDSVSAASTECNSLKPWTADFCG
uniref:Uncharacterized protein n=1 Tax=Arundo donax TaxID=35708 RepID=A0A0A8XXE0_ARUDO